MTLRTNILNTAAVGNLPISYSMINTTKTAEFHSLMMRFEE